MKIHIENEGDRKGMRRNREEEKKKSAACYRKSEAEQ